MKAEWLIRLCVQVGAIGVIGWALFAPHPKAVDPPKALERDRAQELFRDAFPSYQNRVANAVETDRVRWLLARALARAGKVGAAQDVLERCSDPKLGSESLGPLILEWMRVNPEKAQRAVYHVADPLMRAETLAFVAAERAIAEPERVVELVNCALSGVEQAEQKTRPGADSSPPISALQ
jgi:hypothetical protein